MSSMMDQAMGQMGGMGGGMGGPPPSIELPGAEAAAPASSPGETLQSAIDAMQSYIDGEKDDIDKQVALEVQAKIQSLLAKSQKEMESAQGVTPVHRGMARMTAQSQGAAGSGGY